MSYVSVDVETDGEVPGDSSMIELGAVFVRPGLADAFHGLLSPVSSRWSEEALRVSGHTRQETLLFPSPEATMWAFEEWLRARNVGERITGAGPSREGNGKAPTSRHVRVLVLLALPRPLLLRPQLDELGLSILLE